MNEKRKYRVNKTKAPTIRAIYDRLKRTVVGKTKNGKSKHDNTAHAPISIEVYYDRKRLYLPTGIKIFPDQWNEKDGIVIRHQSAASLNNIILKMKTDILDYVQECMKANVSFSLDGLKDHLNKKDEAQNGSFLDFFYERTMNKPISPGTRKGYISTYNVLAEWGKIQKFSDVTTANILQWDELAHARAVKADFAENLHKRLRTIIGDAVKLGFITKNPYDDFRLKRDMSIKHEFLTLEELNRFTTVDLFNDVLIRARDFFIFQTYTGMSFCDARKFDINLCKKDNGKIRYMSKRTKTGESFQITLLKPAVAILERNAYKLPVIDEHVYNRALKTICQLAGIQKSISSHCARVTWASTVALGHGVPLKVLAVTMGHSTTHQTELYAKLQQIHVDDCMDALDDKL